MSGWNIFYGLINFAILAGALFLIGRKIVKGMLQKNNMAAGQLTRLKVYRGAEHKHAAQKPEVWDR